MSALPTQPLEVRDFSLGITDYFIDGDPRAAEVMDNLFLTPNMKAKTRWGSVAVNDQLPLGQSRITKITQLGAEIIPFQHRHAYYDDSGVWTEIFGPTAGFFMPAGDSNSIIQTTEWQEQLLVTSDAFCSPQKLYKDGAGDFQVRNAGLPTLPAGFSVTSPSGSGSSYLYAAHLSFSYAVGTVTYLDRGPVYYYGTAVQGGAINGGNSVTVSLPTTYATPENWDTAAWKIEIYRTADAGDVYYKIGEVTFGTSSFVDNFDDATIQATGETVYTTGGIYSNDTPPKAKYVHAVNDFTYWAHIKEGLEVRSTEIRQSKAGDPDSVPAAFVSYTELPIRGVSSCFDRPVVLCDRYIYRIDNYIADDGSGGMLLRRIDDKAGCVSSQSIVQTPFGLFWAGEQGFYWTDGFRVTCVSDHLNKTYHSLVTTSTRQSRIVGTFDPNNQRVIWAVSINDGNSEPDKVFTLDLKFPFIPDGVRKGGTFTTMTGGDSFRPTQLLRIGNYFYRGDTRGYIFKHGEEYLTDPKVNTLLPTASWGTQVIEHTYSSCFLDFGSKFYRKWVPRILISADNTTNLSLAISSSNDNNRVTGNLKPIRYKNNISWGDSLPLWGDPSALWNVQGLIEEWRRFPAGGLRCNYKQITLTNALVQIVDSSLLGLATVNPVANTATLGGSYQWLPDILDYYISFAHDNYTQQFKITGRTNTTVTYEDTLGADPSVAGNYNWILKGKPKGEILLLHGYVIHWAYISKSHTPFSSASLGSHG